MPSAAADPDAFPPAPDPEHQTIRPSGDTSALGGDGTSRFHPNDWELYGMEYRPLEGFVAPWVGKGSDPLPASACRYLKTRPRGIAVIGSPWHRGCSGR